MSTIYIYPLQSTQQLIDSKGISFIESNGDEKTPSSITAIIPIEVPISALDTNIPAKTQNQQPQRFWLSNTPPTSVIEEAANDMHSSTAQMTANSDFVESCTVTHSFANRKRSIVKRRKSVLSSSFTADDENEKNTVDIEANPAVLETTVHNVEEVLAKEKVDLKEIEKGKIHEEEGIHLKNDGDLKKSDLAYDRGSNQQGEEIGFAQNPASENKTTLNPKDSAIDLSTTALKLQLQKDELDQNTLTGASTPISPTRSTSSDSLCSSSSSSFEATPQTFPIAPKKKKVSSWSPRKIFQSDSEKKLSKKASISSMQSDKKFSISSLFHRKSSSSENNKSSFSYSNKQGPGSSSTETLALPTPLPPPTPPLFNHTRLPIHTERAIYRLSHIKLANTKRPLRDQVVISNLMFWYLSIANQPYEENTNSFVSISKKGTSRKQLRRKIRSKQMKKSKYQSPYSQTSSSSDEEDEEDSDDDEELLTSSDEEPRKEKKKKKYSLFYKKKGNTSWLPSFAVPKQHDVTIRDNEDDIPLAMYQRSKK